MSVRRLLATTLIALAAFGCAGSSSPEPTEASEPTEPGTSGDAVVYEVRGVFVRPAFDGRAARVDHETIPDFMEAMAMDLRLADPAEIEGLQPGDKIRFKLTVDDLKMEMSDIELLPPETELQLADAAH